MQRTMHFDAIKFIACALIFVFLMVSSVSRVAAMDLRSCPHETFSVTGTICANHTDQAEVSAIDKQLAREEIEQMNLGGSSDYDRALRRGLLLATPFFLLFGVAAFLKSA